MPPINMQHNWSLSKENQTLISLLRSGEKEKAVRYIKDVHWEFNYPDNFIRTDSHKRDRGLDQLITYTTTLSF